MKIKDRIKELRRVPARELIPNPKNWRHHPTEQQKLLGGTLREIGYADALLARENKQGQLVLIDGHLRAETTPNQNVPVLVLDVTEDEADKLLALLDPLAAMAETDQRLLAELVAEMDSDEESMRAYFDAILHTPCNTDDTEESDAKNLAIPELLQVVVECQNESEQKGLYKRLCNEGFPCRILNL